MFTRCVYIDFELQASTKLLKLCFLKKIPDYLVRWCGILWICDDCLYSYRPMFIYRKMFRDYYNLRPCNATLYHIYIVLQSSLRSLSKTGKVTLSS